MKRLLLACLIVAGCTNESVDGTVSGHAFHAADGWFTNGGHAWQNGAVVIRTYLDFSSESDPCNAAGASAPLIIGLSAGMATGDEPTPLAAHTTYDFSVKAPGAFPLGTTSAPSAFASANITVQTSPTFSQGYGDNFDGGFVHVSSVSASQLSGELDWTSSTTGDHVKGTFTLRYCNQAFF